MDNKNLYDFLYDELGGPCSTRALLACSCYTTGMLLHMLLACFRYASTMLLHHASCALLACSCDTTGMLLHMLLACFWNASGMPLAGNLNEKPCKLCLLLNGFLRIFTAVCYETPSAQQKFRSKLFHFTRDLPEKPCGMQLLKGVA